MSRFFDYYTQLEKRFLFNSFLVVAALVEVLILVFTLIWQMDEGIFSDQVKVVPFPWTEYLFASFTAPLVLLFLFGAVIWGFEALFRARRPESQGQTGPEPGYRPGWWVYLLVLPALVAFLLLLILGKSALSAAAALLQSLGAAGVLVLAALAGLALLCLSLSLILSYRLKKKALEYQYLLQLARAHGLAVLDTQAPANPDLTPGEKKNLPPLPEKLPPPASGEIS